MNRREFCQSAVCAAVVAALSVERERLPYQTFSHDGTDINMKFCNAVWWQYSNLDIMVSDGISIKELRKAWGECERV